MNILISINKAYLDAAEVMLTSLANKANDKIDVYLLNKDISQEDIVKFSNKLEKRNIFLNTVSVTNSFLDELPTPYPFSKEIYYRLVAQFVLPKELDRILWLDSDILILNDITNFYEQDFEGNYIVACPDANYDTPGITKIKNNIGLTAEHIYFNSGVLLLNLDALRKNTTLNDIKNCAPQLKDKFKYPDQDILNVLYHGKVKYADHTIYNYQAFHSKKNICLDNVAILHYVGHRKPWQYKFRGTHSKYWWKEARKLKGFFFKKIRWAILSFCYKIFDKFLRRKKPAVITEEEIF